ncbi:Putative phage-related site-specific serine recombinase [Magnetospirillum sp. UT-4]|nr:Putative phage-related site-specific serine recombinase [Magnetospirillum sp. UT-4]
MSTEHQQYSTENQSDAIRQYAALHGFEIVRTYADEGISGLSVNGRNSFQTLLDDVENGRADFSAILVYDVSRWGRFQNPDEGAYYELCCDIAGIKVHYCAEQFGNDGSPFSHIIKALKRMMAGEYPRELSVKVFTGQRRLIGLGYRQGGPAGFGLRRQMIDHTGAAKGELSRGEQKSIHTDRVILVPGPPEEVEAVRWIYRAFVDDGLPEREIAARLNSRGIATDLGRPWTRATVHQVLINEKYIGNNVWNRRSFKLKQKRVRNEPDDWIRADGAFEPIVDRTLFAATNDIIARRSVRLSNGEMLDGLKALLLQHGYLSGLVIDECDGMPSSGVYRHRFGSLVRAYSLIGYDSGRDTRYIEINRALRDLHPAIVAETMAHIRAIGGRVEVDPDTDLLTINEEFTVSLVLSRCQDTAAGSRRWVIRFDTGLAPDITVAVRMAPGNQETLDYYLLPAIAMTASRIRLAERNEAGLDTWRFDTLDALYLLARRTTMKEIA